MIKLTDVNWVISAGTPLEKRILQGLNLEVRAGEFVTLIGTNGAGKSTLLNIISGEAQLTSGEIEIAGKRVTNWSSHQRAGLIARVFQDPMVGTCGEMTIAENMTLACRRGKSRGLRMAISSELKDEFRTNLKRLNLGLENRLDIPMNQLSGGQRQAVSLVMSTLTPLKILLLDEHTSALDPKTAEMVLTLTEQLAREKNLTVLMITHSLSQALRFGTRTVLLHRGRIARDYSDSARTSLSSKDLFELYHSD
jgi:putative ABC transport system ATP-binding protein